MELKNGADILRIKVGRTMSNKNVFEGVVMARSQKRPSWSGQFVTWQVWSTDGGESYEAAHGHYFDTFHAALTDYERRQG